MSKIFRQSLKKGEKSKMINLGLKAVNPLVTAAKARKRQTQQKREERELDEAIVVDSDDLISSEDDEDTEMLDVEADMAPSNLLDDAASTKQRSSKSSAKKDDDQYITPQEVKETIKALFQQEREILQLVYSYGFQGRKRSLSADMFFIEALLVPPNKYRPEAKTSDGRVAEAREHQHYKGILVQCDRIQGLRNALVGSEIIQGQRERTFRDFQNAWIALQDAVNVVFDSNLGPYRNPTQRVDGIKQRLEKKEGLFRMNMMGKRVNFAARSVISPDPNIETNEIGVPPVFAMKLTYPEPVTNHSYPELRQAVLNGLNKWPGASAVENENGQVINLRTKNFEERQAIANQLLAPSSTNVNGSRNKKVHRHLTNGDVVLMNRQPTLHKPSIMAHRARILPGEKTIRMHYANCNTYNADFDGDEMNMHFPQNELARAEALQIADTDHQYLVATSGKPLRGLIQDHISMGVWLTNRDTFFDRADYHQLLCSCLRPEKDQTNSEKIETVVPAVVKPKALWTGKQLVTTVLKNIRPSTHPGITLQGRSQTPGDSWTDELEGQVVIDDGQLLCGILDKAQLGPSTGGFIHAVYEAYGHTIAGRLLSILGRLLTKFLHMSAFSCGIEDLRLTSDGEAKRIENIQGAANAGLEVAAKYVTLENISSQDTPVLQERLEEVYRDEVKHKGLDNVYNTRTSTLSSAITAACLPSGLAKSFPRNQMQAMTTSGAKGSSVNANFISCNLGQQNLEGRRVPVMISGKTLPSFKPFETSIRAGGYIVNRFLTGIRPQEYYFHAMAGREGLVDTAVKTASSGYLQRCIIKAMEGVKSEYDASVRDFDGSVVQFLYGEDGLDVTKQKHLTDFRFQADNFMSLVENMNLREEFSKLIDRGIMERNKNIVRKVKKTLNKKGKIDEADTVLALFNPNSNVGSTSEAFYEALKKYTDNNLDHKLKVKLNKRVQGPDIRKKQFISLMNTKYMKSTIEPGEAVGVLAGQSIGEPSTQMTLNTFHLAGHAAKNVTLGIPRLREIVMSASKNIKTPTMSLHLIPELPEEAGEKFAKGITRLTLAEVTDTVRVSEKIGKGIGYDTAKIYTVRLKLFSAVEYCNTYAITIEDVLRTIEDEFIPLLAKIIQKELKRKGNARILKESDAQPEVGASSGRIEEARSNPDAELEGGEDDAEIDGEDGEEDATDAKQRNNRAETVSYENPDEEEEQIAKDARRHSAQESGDEVDSAMGDSPRASSQTDNKNGDEAPGPEEARAIRVTAQEREDRVKEKTSDVSQFTFDTDNAEWCEIQFEYDITTSKLLLLPLVETVCRDAVIQSIPNLYACTYTKEKVKNPITGQMEDESVVLTQGVNLKAMQQYQDILNPHRIFTNDIWQMMRIYGVEAGRATLIREMDAVFKGHSITVDMRHLNLIADFMTRAGGFKPFSRMGLESSVSPLHKASFETTTNFVREAVLGRDTDDLKNPSARIVLGKLSNVGTGCFDVLNPIDESGEGA